MRVSTAVSRYLRWVKLNLTAKTHKTYKERLCGFTQHFKSAELADLREPQLESFFRSLCCSPDTLRLTLTAFEQFQRWAVRERYLRYAICAPIRKPKGRQRQRIPTEDEQRAILENGTDEFRRIFQALRLSGARPKELCGADIEDYDQVASLIILQEHKTCGRSGKARRIGVGYRLREILRVEIGDRETGPIFRDEKGLRWRPNQLSARYRRLRNKAGLSKELVLYSATRHEHGTRTTRKLGIHAAAHSMGHASIMTTMRYTHPDDKELPRYQDLVYDF